MQQLASKALKRRALRHLVAAIQEYLQHKRRCRCAPSTSSCVLNLHSRQVDAIMWITETLLITVSTVCQASWAEHAAAVFAERQMICWLRMPSHASCGDGTSARSVLRARAASWSVTAPILPMSLSRWGAAHLCLGLHCTAMPLTDAITSPPWRRHAVLPSQVPAWMHGCSLACCTSPASHLNTARWHAG